MRKVEAEIAQNFAKLRKDWAGKGAVDTQARVCADTIFIRYRASYSPFEKALLYALMRNGTASAPADAEVQTMMKEQSEIMLNEVFPGERLKIIRVYALADPSIDSSHVVLVLNQNIERICQQRAAKRDSLPDGQANQSGVASQSKR